MNIGVHVAVGDGYEHAVSYAKHLGCTAIQIFSSNPRTYRVSPINEPAQRAFAELRKAVGIQRCVIHTPYLINLASEEERISQGSQRLLAHDLETAAVGGIDYVNTHLGSYGKRDRKEGFTAIVRALSAVVASIRPGVTLVLENSAGAGALAGGTLDELAQFVKAVDHPQLGICLDTAHAWAAGYDLHADPKAFIDEAAEKLGIHRIVMFHFNDTQIPLGGNKDRHWHIGEGNIGREAFAYLLHRSDLKHKTAILETPGDEADDARNMATLRALS